ncbi:egg cell-secreted protein 1.2-like [Impatiens glandulifera]|uniref:egg cell-secreted protein 1.2-like n=1 Tax=Impatiens glandulifera TaxID=253017 RepID=UPI001FB0832F|nr:egg cell-secreted protein 1.2-like [Impatiens glandulifera]
MTINPLFMKIDKLVLFFSLTLLVTFSMGRPIFNNNNIPTLRERLKLDEGNGTSYLCWESMFELRSCTGEMVSFFLNGETYLGTECCRAIETIQRHCWPSLFGSIGYTTQESDILYDYCATELAHTLPSPPPPRVNGEVIDHNRARFNFSP